MSLLHVQWVGGMGYTGTEDRPKKFARHVIVRSAAGTGRSSNWGQAYVFDGFGSLLQKNITTGSGPSLSVSVNQTANQIQGVSGLSYDANGNQNVGTFDAENRLIMAGTMQYAYDTQNRRIWSWSGAKDSLGNATGYTMNIYTSGGQTLGAYTLTPGTYQNGPILAFGLTTSDQYFGGRRLATMDQLGSVGTYFPWGENEGSSNPQNTWSYATYWRDSATSLDYANNRYYSNAYGRFMTPDPYTNSGRLTDPQSWNRYAYTRGDPVNRVDVTGTDDTPTFSITVLDLINTPPIISWPQQSGGGGWGTSQYWASAIGSALAVAASWQQLATENFQA